MCDSVRFTEEIFIMPLKLPGICLKKNARLKGMINVNGYLIIINNTIFASWGDCKPMFSNFYRFFGLTIVSSVI